jgi:integrase
MIQLANGCNCSNPSVHPKNWDKAGADPLAQWYISYRFYDPQETKPKQVLIKGLNHLKTLIEKREAVKVLLAQEMELLKVKGWNPISKTYMIEPGESVIEPSAPFIHALRRALVEIEVDDKTRKDIGYYLDTIGKAAKATGLDALSIGDVRRRHIRALLKQCRKQKKEKWSANQFNVYRKYLKILFSELLELEAIGADPVSSIKKQKTVRKQRAVLTGEERTKIDDFLRKNHFYFWRFLQIFFHSGARESELMRLKVADIDLKNQRYKCIVRKGRQPVEVWKVIKDIALPFWKEQLELVKPEDQFLFSRGLLPGVEAIRPDQITKRWYRLVKQQLNIEADFYLLKHLNTTEVSELLGEQAAASLNSHSSTAMVVNIYDVNNKKRKDERLKKVANKFA